MRVLVTGASGFVGGHLIRRLAIVHHVIAVTRREVAVPGAAEVRIVPAIDSSTDWAGILEDVDVVLHLAARVHVMNETSENPLEEFREVNLRGTERLAEACASQGVKRFVFMSSIKVNGEETDGAPYVSSDAPSPVDPYGVSKWEAEQSLTRISTDTGMEVVVLRPTVVYGLGVKGNIERIIRLLKTRLPLPLGAVHNRRTMLSVDNLSLWVSRAINEPTVPRGPVLIGDPAPVSTRTLVSALGEGLGLRTWLLAIPVSWMESAARLARREALALRLFGDLEVQPTFDAFPGIETELGGSATALRSLGEDLRPVDQLRGAGTIPRDPAGAGAIGQQHASQPDGVPGMAGDSVEPPTKTTVLVIANHNLVVYNFRRELLQRLVSEGYRVIVALPAHARNQLLREMGCSVVDTTLSRFGTNPFRELLTLLEYVRLMHRAAPQVVLTLTVKPNVYGGLAAQYCRVPYISTVTGLGVAFQSKGLLQRISSHLQRAAYRRARIVFFENLDNLRTFQSFSIVSCPTEILPGSGVNLEAYRLEPYLTRDRVTRFITVARVRRDKGFEELLKVIRALGAERDDVEFHVAGRFEDEHYIDVAAEMQRSYPVVFHGSISAERVRELVAESHCLIHPSHHEGMSNAILEAAATGRPVIASDIPGCREAIDHGVSGILFQVRDADALHAAIVRFLALSRDTQEAMGAAGRSKMEAGFNRDVVVERYLQEIELVFQSNPEGRTT